jgi:haloacetate dehalogenase
MDTGMIDRFDRHRLPGHDGVGIDALVGGSGPPLLLLHGYPQTRMAWKAVAPRLASQFTVVVPDLRGYGRSDKPAGDSEHRLYSKRTMALDQLAVMRSLGHERFAVAGHDRGGRVAYRLALDHPERVSRLAVLNIIPTIDMWEAADAQWAFSAYHWLLLAQPAPLPETLISSDPGFYLRHTMTSWAGERFEFDRESVADYVECLSDPASIHATCEDYRAGWTIDRTLDEQDRDKRKIAASVFALWGEQRGDALKDPVAVWKKWANDVQGEQVSGGHFVCEEAAEATADALSRFFSPLVGQ